MSSSDLSDLKPETPTLRGIIHTIMSPLTFLSGMVLIIFHPTLKGRLTLGLLTFCALLLFTGSSLYHRINWQPKYKSLWRRIDHANITLLIAGTYTPFILYLVDPDQLILPIFLLWGSTLLLLILRIFWVNSPRWLYLAGYLLLGWSSLFYLPTFLTNGGALIFSLLLIGGVCYSLGALIYGLKKPNFSTRHFGFHELFHALTALAFALQFTAAALVINA